MAIYRVIYTCLLWLLCYTGNAQIITLQIQCNTNYPLQVKQQHTSAQEATLYVQQQLILLQKKGFVTCVLDSIITYNNFVTAYIFLGKQYKKNNIAIVYNNDATNMALPLTIKHIEELPFLKKQIVQAYALVGYPFCSVNIDSVYQNNIEQLAAYVTINKGILYVADSVVINGSVNISNRFIEKFTTIKKGTLYNEKVLKQIDEKINQLPFLETTAPTQINMLATKYRVNMFLQAKKSNQINVLVGLMPSNNQNNGKTLFTGEATLQLHNVFAKGELLYLHWQQLQPQTPLLDVLWKQPYILNSNWSSIAQFNLFRRDSSFLNINAIIGGQYQLNTNEYVQVGIQLFSTNIITVDTALLAITKQLPSIADSRTNLFQIAFVHNTLNNNLNATKGRLIEIQANAGTKKILKNNQVVQLSTNNFNYAALYDSVQLNTYQTKVIAKWQQVISLQKQRLLFVQTNLGWLQSGNYFTNELFRIGGIKLLRGFDEESILANKYAIASIAYRLQLGNSGFFETFIDGGFTANNVHNTSNNFISAGFGLALQSKQGILNISIANGKQNNLPFNARQTKLHIGFVSLF